MAREVLTAEAMRSLPAAVVLALLDLPALALAEPPSPDAPTPATALASADDGFGLSSADGRFALKLSGYVQGDTRLHLADDADAGVDGFLVRRARPILEGTLYGFVSFRLMPDFGNGQALVQDAHVDLKPSKELRLRVGKFKAPFGLERLLSGASLSFIERALPAVIAPNRDVGAMLHGELLDARIVWALAAMNGVPDGGSADANLSDDVDLVARLVVRPFRAAGLAWLENLELGGASTVGDQAGTPAATGLASYRTAAGQMGFFKYLSDETPEGTVVTDGRRVRVTAQGSWRFDRLSLLGEWVRAAHRVRLGDHRKRLENDAWQVAATVLLTCDQAAFDGVEPRAPIDLGAGHFGAVELAARAQGLRVDPATFPVYASPSSSAHRALAFGFGVNWYLNAAFKLQVDFERTTFEGGAPDGGNRAAENVLSARAQVRY